MRRFPQKGSAFLAGLAVIVLSGCTVGPKYSRPQVPTIPTFRGPDESAVSGTNTPSLGDERWSEVFKEPELQELIRTAIKNNYDLAVAAQRVLEQQAQVRITRSQQFPTLNVGGTGVGAELPASLGSAIDSPIVAGSFNLQAAWTPDFWGLYRRQTEAARAVLLQQKWAQRAVQLSVVQQTAATYFQLRALDRQLEIAKQTLKIRQNSVELTRKLQQGGSAPLSDVRQAEQLLYTASAQIPQIEQQIQQAENSLRVLLGQTPGPVAHVDQNALTPPPSNLPVGLPSQLLERRPDIQAAEQQLVAANAQIGVARAQFFPQLTISASGGIGGDSLGNLFDPAGRTVYGLGQLAQPIFAGGRLKGQLQLAEQAKKRLVLNYQNTILGAFRDVSNALIAYQKQRSVREEQEKLVAAAQDATRLARLRYQGGATGYLEVLTTDSALFSVQLNLVTAQQSEALTLVQLYSALGGGWKE